jgi:hypothetical protein
VTGREIDVTGTTFSFSLPSFTSYGIEVARQPANPAQTCAVVNGAGTLAGADVGNVNVVCEPPADVTLTTSIAPAGAGGALSCNGVPCAPSFDYDYGTPVQMVAAPTSDQYEFVSWTVRTASGEAGCPQPGATPNVCTVSMTQPHTVTATFRTLPARPPP